MRAAGGFLESTPRFDEPLAKVVPRLVEDAANFRFGLAERFSQV
jgi:hypothetical protein